jgi:NRAMP (natural resistance-associated macrophage protein)-like metal ion transporter
LVTAAFIGPGTLTTCTLVGVTTGYELLWVMLFSVLATITLQEMSARLGLITQKGLGEAFNRQFTTGVTRLFGLFLIIGAVLIGNAAYEAGNLAGGVLGIELIFGQSHLWPLLIAFFSFTALYFGRYRWLEKILIALVLAMSFCFLLTVIMVRPNLSDILSGFIPVNLSADRLLLILALLGTTVVPYNLFLHASVVSKKWHHPDDLKALRWENAGSIAIGGLISIFIILTAASSSSQVEGVNSAADLAIQLEPLAGAGARWLMGTGLMAAGLSSALTAPMAAAYAAKGLFKWPDNETDYRFRLVWMVILGIGLLVTLTDLERVLIIKFAQITNALLLPLVAIYLLYLSNQSSIMGKYRNGLMINVLGGFVILVALLLSFRTLNTVFNLL